MREEIWKVGLLKTIVRGELVADNFEVIGKLGYGKHVTRRVISK